MPLTDAHKRRREAGDLETGAPAARMTVRRTSPEGDVASPVAAWAKRRVALGKPSLAQGIAQEIRPLLATLREFCDLVEVCPSTIDLERATAAVEAIDKGATKPQRGRALRAAQRIVRSYLDPDEEPDDDTLRMMILDLAGYVDPAFNQFELKAHEWTRRLAEATRASRWAYVAQDLIRKAGALDEGPKTKPADLAREIRDAEKAEAKRWKERRRERERKAVKRRRAAAKSSPG